MVSRVVFGRGSFNQLGDIIGPKRLNRKAPFIFLVDDVFKNNRVRKYHCFSQEQTHLVLNIFTTLHIKSSNK